MLFFILKFIFKYTMYKFLHNNFYFLIASFIFYTHELITSKQT
jgi:hypothetical protein